MSVTLYMKVYSAELCCVKSIEICENLVTNLCNFVDMFQHVSGIFRPYLVYVYIYFRSSHVGTSSMEAPLYGSYEDCLHGIHTKQITPVNIYKNTTKEGRSHQWKKIGNRQ
jgi:hypothetical protein